MECEDGMIYLDNSSTTKPLEEVCRIMDHSMREEWGNPSSIHQLGHLAEKQIKACKKKLAEALACDPQEILITSCGTESINTNLKGFWEAYPRAGRHMVTSMGEHKATTETCRYLQKKGVRVDFLPLNTDGTIRLDRLQDVIRPDTSLLSFLHVNNETGAVLDTKELLRLRNQLCPNAMIHLDCIQSFGKLPEKIGRLGVEYASVSAHKIHGPKGIGLLYHRKSAKIAPLIHGGGQQDAMRSGTENLPSIQGFAAAAHEACKEIDSTYRRITGLNQLLRSELTRLQIPFIHYSAEAASPYIFNAAFPGIRGETLLHTLESRGVYVSTQSACSSRNQKVSPVLLAMGIEAKDAECSIRISFCRFNTEDEILQAAKIIKEAIGSLSQKK
jgi:cysteine desulfurase